MSLFFGSRQKTKPQFSSLQVQSSSNNLPLPLVWGLTRLAPNLMWYGDFKAKKVKQGGKGGGGKGGGQYTYSASIQMAICQGVSEGILRVFRDNEKNSSLSKLGLTFFSGADPQAAWSYLVTKYPAAALSYPGTVHVDKANYDLGGSASLPQHSFETKALRYNTQVGGEGDADPALCVQDLLTLPVGGCGFPTSLIDMTSLLSGALAPTTGDSAFQTYCRAMGFGISPALTSQEEALTVLERWGKILNTAVIWNGAVLKFVPYALETLVGNGVTYIPPITAGGGAPVYTLDDDDYISKEQDPIIINRKNPRDVKNRLQMEILNRSKEYNAVPIEWIDQALVDTFGNRQDAVFNAHEVCVPSMATTLVSLMGQRNAFRGNNEYKFILPPTYCLVEPMDVLALIDPVFGTISVQVDRVEEDEEYNLTFTCSQLLQGSMDSKGFTPPDQTLTGNDEGVDPGPVNPPIFIEPISLLAGNEAQVWAAVSGGTAGVAGPYWGGAFVWVSSDNATYTQIGEVTEPARMGKTTTALAVFSGTNPDIVNTVGVNLAMSLGELVSVSSTDALNAASLCFLDGELLSFKNATLTGVSLYTLGGELYRKLYGTTSPAHLTNTDFVRIDDTIFKYKLPVQYIGQTLYFKFQSYNIFGLSVQDLSTCVAYIFTPAGKGYGGGVGGVPVTPATPSASASTGYNTITWTANAASDNVIRYDIYRAAGTGAAFGTATKIGSAVGTSYTDTTAAAGSAYTYFVVAVNAVNPSVNSAGVNVTSSPAPTVVNPYGFAFQFPDPVISKPIAYFDTPVAWTMPTSLTDSQGSLGISGASPAVAPTVQTDFDIQSPVGTSVGTMRFAASALTATFIKAADTAIPLGQPVVIIAPANLNGLAGMLYGSIKGTR